VPIVIRPAALAFDASGTPFSEKFGDVYHSADSGPAQARHVFLNGNRLPPRWRGQRIFTVVETGFGIGLNFMATWAAWRSDADRCERLHFVSIERHPFTRADLGELHVRYPEFSVQSHALCAAWPPVIAGTHRLHFEDGRVTLTLAFSDVLPALRGLRLSAHAFYLDGFAPDRNPDMWSPAVMKALARLALPEATAATYTTARSVRDALAGAGFDVEKAEGFGRKREMLKAHFAPRWPVGREHTAAHANKSERSALVIGAGLAGSAIAERLAVRGWKVDIVEHEDAVASGASGLHAGVLQPHLSHDDCILSRFTRAAFLYSQALRGSRHSDLAGSSRAPSGTLQIADRPEHEKRMQDELAAFGYPAEYAQFLDRDDASAHACHVVSGGGWWIPMGDWARPADVVRARLQGANEQPFPPRISFRSRVASLSRCDGRWRALDASGAEIASAAVAVVANAGAAAQLVDLTSIALQRVRGQLTLIPTRASLPRTVVCGRGYVLPPVDGKVVVGASFDPEDDSMQPQAADDVANLRRAERLLPGFGATLDLDALQGEVGMRCVAPDRMPMVGSVVDIARARETADALRGAHASDMPRVPGLFCSLAFASRGLVWAPLAAECIASQIEGEPLPIEGALVDAIDPGRFAVKRARRGML
jgi:tRNA 5-methylaminomethyl-2-thiouridine biosynthesis bifunctional protein